MLPNDLFSFIELAKLESAITGIMAGFALTIVVLLIERQASTSKELKYNSELGKASIEVFVAAFFISVLASFMFALVGAERAESARASFMLLIPAFPFVLSAVLLMLGLNLCICAYGLWEVAGRIRTIIPLATVIISLLHYTYTVNWTITIMYPTPTTAPTLIEPSLYGIPLLCLIVSGLFMWKRCQSGVGFDSRGCSRFTLFCVVVSSLMSGPALQALDAPLDMWVPPPEFFILVTTLSILSAWSLLHIPRRPETSGGGNRTTDIKEPI